MVPLVIKQTVLIHVSGENVQNIDNIVKISFKLTLLFFFLFFLLYEMI